MLGWKVIRKSRERMAKRQKNGGKRKKRSFTGALTLSLSLSFLLTKPYKFATAYYGHKQKISRGKVELFLRKASYDRVAAPY